MYKFILVAAVAASFAFTSAAWAEEKAPAKPKKTTTVESTTKVQSDVSAKYSQFNDGIAQNFK